MKSITKKHKVTAQQCSAIGYDLTKEEVPNAHEIYVQSEGEPLLDAAGNLTFDARLIAPDGIDLTAGSKLTVIPSAKKKHKVTAAQCKSVGLELGLAEKSKPHETFTRIKGEPRIDTDGNLFHDRNVYAPDGHILQPNEHKNPLGKTFENQNAASTETLAHQTNRRIRNYCKRIVGLNPVEEHTNVRPEVRVSLLTEMLTQAVTLLAGDQPEIFKAYDRALKSHTTETPSKKFSFPLSIKIRIEPIAHDYDIKSQVSFSTKHVCNIQGSVRAEPDMFEGECEDNTFDDTRMEMTIPGKPPVTTTMGGLKKVAKILKQKLTEE